MLWILLSWMLQAAWVDEVTQLHQNSNPYRKEQFLRVQRGMEAIQVARGNLLPSLNVWRLASALVEPGEILMSAQNFIPFFIPGNWLRLSETKKWSKAEALGFEIFVMNQLLKVRSLAHDLESDASFLESMDAELARLRSLLSLVQNVSGFSSPKAALGLQLQIGLLESDQRAWRQLFESNWQELAQMVPQVSRPKARKPQPLTLSIPEDIGIFPKVRELRQVDELILGTRSATRSFYWLLLGLNPIFRTENQRPLDEVPAPDGLGLGVFSSVRISQAELKKLELFRDFQKKEWAARQAQLGDRMMLLLEEQTLAFQRLELLNSHRIDLETQVRLGARVEPLSLVEAAQQLALAQRDIFRVQGEILKTQEALQRWREAPLYENFLKGIKNSV